jgi:glycyl-tRNA synthetase beta chain
VDTIQAVQALNPASPLDFDRRLKAVQHFRELPEASALAAANKRVGNILAKESVSEGELNPALFEGEEERALAEKLTTLQAQAAPLLANQQYTPALTAMASLREPIDLFFNRVMVMADDPAVRENRLRLLNRLRTLFLSVADIGLLQG